MKENYLGPKEVILLDARKGISVEMHPITGIPIRFLFSGDRNWTEDQARKYIQNKKLNETRYKSDRTSLAGGIRLAARDCDIELVKGDEESEIVGILGKAKYARLQAIEDKYGSEKPFIVKMTAMDFGGKDAIIADSPNGLFRFHKKGTIENIDSFEGIPMYLGHASFLQSFQKRVANTVKSFEDEKGNPAVYAYIYPHDEAGSLREDLLIAEAQGQLNTFQLSCTGDPIDYEVIDDKEHKDFGKVDVDVETWRAESLDFVSEGAVSGSQLDSIVNTLGTSTHISYPGGKKLEITLSDAFAHLNEKKIRLSELVEGIPDIKAAIDRQVSEALAKQKDELLTNGEFIKAVVEKADKEVLLSSDVVQAIVDEKFEKHLEEYDEAVESIDKLAKDNDVDLTTAQLQFVKNNLRGGETDQEKISLIQAAAQFANLKGVDGFFDDKKEDKGKDRVMLGASVREIDSSKVKIEI
jgi:hypothetical protein